MEDMDEQRPTPLLEDPEATKAKLEAWFAQRLGLDEVSIPSLDIPEATGMSNVTLLFDVHHREAGELVCLPCVGRLQPEIEKPVFPDYDLSTQYRAMGLVAEHSDVPVPELLGLELDTALLGVAFYIMRRIEGRVPSDMPPYNMDGWMMHDIDAVQRAQLWNAGVDAMAELHRDFADYTNKGFDFLPRDTAQASCLEQQLAYWQDYHRWAFDGEVNEACEQAMQWLVANKPSSERYGLCWGDARIANMMFTLDNTGVAAVLDWEMITAGNPLQDLAWWNYLDVFFSAGLGMPRLEGLPTYADSLARWEETSGFSAEHYHYYMIFAGLRYGLILSRIMYGQGQDEQVQSNFATDLLLKLMSGEIDIYS